MSTAVRVTGHIQVKGSPGSRRYYALWRDAAGRDQRLLGPAHIKESGRRTARGAVVWRAGDGPKPTAEHLTPREAGDLLAGILSRAPVEEQELVWSRGVVVGSWCRARFDDRSVAQG